MVVAQGRHVAIHRTMVARPGGGGVGRAKLPAADRHATLIANRASISWLFINTPLVVVPAVLLVLPALPQSHAASNDGELAQRGQSHW